MRLLEARCGVADQGNQGQYPTQWATHQAEFASLADYASRAPAILPGLRGAEWDQPHVLAYGRYLAAASFAFLVTGDAVTREKIAGWWRQILADSRAKNGGAIGQNIPYAALGEDAGWKGYCMAYDYVYNAFSLVHPGLRDSVALWLYKQSEDGYAYIGGRAALGPEKYQHFYKWPWCADGVMAVLLTVHGDAGPFGVADSAATHLGWTRTFKQFDMDARAKDYCGTYSGYRQERIEEDVAIALAWKSATDEDPVEIYRYHFDNLDDWVMYMTRPGFMESDETGDDANLGPLHPQWVHFSYPMAVREQNPHTLWFLDQALAAVEQDPDPWKEILWNDKALPRIKPDGALVPLGRYFGDLSFDDGYNSEYAHMRSSWDWAGPAAMATVHASFICGPTIFGHDAWSNGHLAIFRGNDILTASTGVYDGTNMRHSKYYTSQPISENTILVQDPQTPLIRQDSTQIIVQAEGMQFPCRAAGSGYVAGDSYDYAHEFGKVTKFKVQPDGGVYLACDLTSAYPNTRKPDLWPLGQTVENVTRQVTFESGKFFVLCDRITSVRASAVKRIVMHCPSESGYTLLDGEWSGGTPPGPGPTRGTPGQWSENALSYSSGRGASRLYATVLYPRPAGIGGEGRKLVRIGGANLEGLWNRGGREGDVSYDFWFRGVGQNYAWDSRYITEHERRDYYDNGWVGFWRMEIEATGARSHVFLHVYEASSAAQAAKTPVAYLEEIDPEHVGCRIETPGAARVNIFSRDESPDERVIYRSCSERPLDHLVADLLPGEYRVEESGSGWTETVEVGRDQLAAFRSPNGGTFRLQRTGPSVLPAIVSLQE